MAVKQLSVFLENKPGELAKAVRHLSDAGINIRALSLADTNEFGILRLITADIERAEQVMSQETIVTVTDVLVVRMDDKSGGLSAVLDELGKEHINIGYMYAFVAPQNNAYAVFQVDQCECADEYLNQRGFVTLDDRGLHDLLGSEPA